VECEDGRTTYVPYKDIEALNDPALEVLTAPGPVVEVHADEVEMAAKADEDDFDTEDMIDEDPEE
jgi:hypothetical protein